MARDVAHPRPTALLIDEAFSEVGLAVQSDLNKTHEVVRRGDVYSGLAQVCALGTPAEGHAEPPNGELLVVVCVDGLGAAEMEFFGLVRRVAPGASVYVYGRPGSTKQIALAVKRGAIGQWSGGAEGIEGTREQGIERGKDQGIEGGREEDGEEEDRSRPVRVPWLRYADAPRRGAPPRGVKSNEIPEGVAPGPARIDPEDVELDRESAEVDPEEMGSDAELSEFDAKEPDESRSVAAPLLTEEELRALIGLDDSVFDDVEAEEQDGEEDRR